MRRKDHSYNYNNQIPGRISHIRETLGLSKRKMSELLGYSNTYISKVERSGEDYIPEYVILNICNTFGVHYDYLVNGDEPVFSHDCTREIDEIFLQLSASNRTWVVKFAKFLLAEGNDGQQE